MTKCGVRNSQRHVPHSTCTAHWCRVFASFLAVLAAVSAPAADVAVGSRPFIRYRDAVLSYAGPSEDFTNLTELRIGWFGPTNLDASLTGDQWWAANLAIRHANEEAMLASRRLVRAASISNPMTTQTPRSGLLDGCSGKRPEGGVLAHSEPLLFRLVPSWAADPWGTGVSRLARMVYDEQLLALIGSVDSASTHLAEQVVAKANLPLVSPITTDKSVTLAGISWMFACAPSDDAIARVLVDDILATLKASESRELLQSKSGTQNPKPGLHESIALKTVADPIIRTKLALLTCTDHESRMTAREVLREFSRRGRLPDLRLDVPAGTSDFSLQMERLGADRPALALIVAGADDAARWAQAVRDKAPATRIFGSQAMGRTRFLELAGASAKGVRFPLLFESDLRDTRFFSLASQAQAERRLLPDYATVLTHDATRLLIEAIRLAGPNRARIREAITRLTPWMGIAGPIEFDGTGQNTRTNLCMASH